MIYVFIERKKIQFYQHTLKAKLYASCKENNEETKNNLLPLSETELKGLHGYLLSYLPLATSVPEEQKQDKTKLRPSNLQKLSQ